MKELHNKLLEHGYDAEYTLSPSGAHQNIKIKVPAVVNGMPPKVISLSKSKHDPKDVEVEFYNANKMELFNVNKQYLAGSIDFIKKLQHILSVVADHDNNIVYGVGAYKKANGQYSGARERVYKMMMKNIGMIPQQRKPGDESTIKRWERQK